MNVQSVRFYLLFSIGFTNILSMGPQITEQESGFDKIPQEILVNHIFAQSLDKQDLVGSIKKLYFLKCVNKKFNAAINPKNSVEMLKAISEYKNAIKQAIEKDDPILNEVFATGAELQEDINTFTTLCWEVHMRNQKAAWGFIEPVYI